ncbi:class I SAM-dependent DNA methyltransferase [Leucobacter salsicius]|uniref:class I SAM-dependent DNA methyltransferase n=1 Tax=Leucobacter salsicius TaxID=664638 RepID=UPI00034D1B25|nr:DNA methyltransferase [Leucobacter salsicius]
MTTDVAQQRLAAKTFADKWAAVKNEKQYGQSFWTRFFTEIVGVSDLLVAGIEFEFPVKNVETGKTQFIDVLWGGIALIEHKSAGKDLDKAEVQARQYLVSLPHKLRPPYVVLSDFARFRIIDVLRGESIEFTLEELPKNLDRINAVFKDYSKRATINETVADKKAVEKMATLYLEFEKAGYEGHDLSVFLVRVLFLLFGDDTNMWVRPKAFQQIVEDSDESGSDLGGLIHQLFDVLDREKERRPQTLPPEFSLFPHVNGGLFQESLPIFYFNKQMRDALLDACYYDWSSISPAIFGSMFQTVKSREDRHQLGEHYTSEANILKVIRPLFLDDYLERTRTAWDDPKKLSALRDELGTRNYLDPACGSGNFLIVAYLRLRDIERKIIARLQELSHGQGQVGLSGLSEYGVRVKLTQFHGIEYEEWSSQIATVAMFLADRQANLALSEIIGEPINRFPLKESATIVCDNSLRIDWADVCPINDNTVIMGNPPFVAAHDLDDDQKNDQKLVWGKTSGVGSLDYVASWFYIAGKLIHNTNAVAGFVSTNSLTQGQQPPVLWRELYRFGIGIDFAHRSFAWWNDGGKVASVHAVIIGFSARTKPATRSMWIYETPKGEPELTKVKNINAYLLDAESVLVGARTKPLNPLVQEMDYGSKPTDGKYLSNISAAEAERIRATDPLAAKYLRRIVGAQELIDGAERYCLWLVDANPTDVNKSPELRQRIEGVRKMRLASTKAKTVEDAKRASEFQEIRQPLVDYIAIPLHTSENREYIPMGLLTSDVIINNALSAVPDGSPLTFGWLMSRPFNVWAQAVSGRIKSDPRISNTITYNNFPFPHAEESIEKSISAAAQAVVAARDRYPEASLADLYNPSSMPSALRDAHKQLDRATLKALGLRSNASDDRVLEELFHRYSQLTGGFLAELEPRKRRR